ncbi:PQQ-binding-like beta-propeller repeat protein [Filimonas lacunae]|uniref:PQQ-binding-like beta-propeller repeat protein n=1 Tax=Filimonas lacunae TaxID=477680 RepID=UPI0013564FEE|nr:PQQ-binding-like beta-propeller repeat protein [Filimonas lacunae]
MKLTLCSFLIGCVLLCCTKKDGSEPVQISITTDTIIDILYNSAVCKATISTDGLSGLPSEQASGDSIIGLGVCYNTASQPVLENSKVTSTSRESKFSCTLTELQPETRYYVRSYYQTTKGTVYGNELQFTTQTLDSAISVFFSGYSTLYCLNASDGKLKWKVNVPDIQDATPVCVQGRVYVGGYDSNLYAFDTSGNLLWQRKLQEKNLAKNPIVKNGLVYISDYANVYAFNAVTGTPVWTMTSEFSNGNYNLTYADGMIFYSGVTSGVMGLAGIDALTGKKTWQTTIASNIPFVTGDKVYAFYYRTLSVVAAKDGSLISRTDITNLNNFRNIQVRNGHVYLFAENMGIIYDSATLAQQAVIYGSAISYNANSQVFVNNSVFTNGTAYDMNSGTLQWKAIEGGATDATVCNGLIYMGGNTYKDMGSGLYLKDKMGYFILDTRAQKQLLFAEFGNDYSLYAPPCVVTRSGKCYVGNKMYE